MAGLLIVRAAPTHALLEYATLDCDPVARELRLWAREPFNRRSANCALSLLAYAEKACGRRRLLWPRLLARFGAGLMWDRPDRLQAVARRALSQLGCREVRAAERGDIGLADMPGIGLTACLCTGPAKGAGAMWAARGARGVVIQPATAALAWTVPCRRS